MSIGAWVEAQHPRDTKGQFASDGAGEKKEPKTLFTDKERSGPDKVTQTATTREKLQEDAKVAHEHSLNLLDRGTGLDKVLGATVVRGDKGERSDVTKIKGPVVMIGPMKNMDARATEKVNKELGGHWEHLSDVVRASIAVDSHKDLAGVMDKLRAAGIELARAPKDRFVNPASGSGYRDALLNVRYPNGHVGEIQLHTKALLGAKNGGGHKLYEAIRSIEGRAKDEKRDLTHDEQNTIREANRASQKLYADAWRKSR